MERQLTEVTYDVDLEDFGHEFIWRVNDGLRLANTRIVDQDAWVAPFQSQLSCCFSYRGRFCDITLEECHRRVCTRQTRLC